MHIPMELQDAIENTLENLPAKKVATNAAELSKRYRSRTPLIKDRFLQSQEDAAAYAAYRMPATFAAVAAALSQAREQLPDFAPRSLLDVGAGPGTVMWAAASVWPDEIERITLFEREQEMIALGKQLSSHASFAPIKNATWTQGDLAKTLDVPSHDLVTTSYVLGELTPAVRETFVRKLWEMTKGTLLLIEPGTPDGFERIRQARDVLLGLGGNAIAPCPHGNACPMTGDNWCHFSQRVARSRLHRQTKDATLSYEDEKFSYICVSRLSGSVAYGRIIRHPQIRKGHTHFELCTERDLESIVITRKDKERYRSTKDLHWGSVMLE